MLFAVQNAVDNFSLCQLVSWGDTDH